MKILLFVFLSLYAALPCIADDITTRSGKTYTDVAIQRIEPDGIHIKHSAGIIKLFVTELPQNILDKYNLDVKTGAEYNARKNAALSAREQEMKASVHAQRATIARKEMAVVVDKANTEKTKPWKVTILGSDETGSHAYLSNGKRAFIQGYNSSADGATLYITGYENGLYRKEGTTAILIIPNEMPPPKSEYRGITQTTK